MKLGQEAHKPGEEYSKWSTQASVVLASKSDSTLADITKKVGYGQGAIFKMQRAKAPDEMQMYQHQGLAWVVAAQSIIRLYKRSKEGHPCHEVFEHQVELQSRAEALADN
eukprot:8522426-Karenia_brevis.AAC.1